MQSKNNIQLILLDIDGVVYDFVNYILPLFDSSKTDKDIVEYTVYLKNLDNLTSKKFIVTIDLIGGIYFRLGVD